MSSFNRGLHWDLKAKVKPFPRSFRLVGTTPDIITNVPPAFQTTTTGGLVWSVGVRIQHPRNMDKDEVEPASKLQKNLNALKSYGALQGIWDGVEDLSVPNKTETMLILKGTIASSGTNARNIPAQVLNVLKTGSGTVNAVYVAGGVSLQSKYCSC